MMAQPSITAPRAELDFYPPIQRSMLVFMALHPGGSDFYDCAFVCKPSNPAAMAGAWSLAKRKLIEHGSMERRAAGGWGLSEAFAQSDQIELLKATREGRAVIENLDKQRKGIPLMDEQISGSLYPHNATMRAELPKGDAGIEATIESMRAIVIHATGSPIMQSIAARLSARADRKDRLGQVRQVRDWARRVLLFKPDGFGQETLRIPEQLIADIAEAGKTSADCDDSAMLIASLLSILGLRTAFVIISTRPGGPFVHVFAAIVTPQDGLVAIDAQEGFAVGTHPPYAERRVFPIAPKRP